LLYTFSLEKKHRYALDRTFLSLSDYLFTRRLASTTARIRTALRADDR